MRTVYGEIPNKNEKTYLRSMIDRVYKILPLKEECSETLNQYISSLLCEMVGNKILFIELADEPRFMSILSNLEFLATQDYPVHVCKSIVFKSIRMLESMNQAYFEDGD